MIAIEDISDCLMMTEFAKISIKYGISLEREVLCESRQNWKHLEDWKSRETVCNFAALAIRHCTMSLSLLILDTSHKLSTRYFNASVDTSLY